MKNSRQQSLYCHIENMANNSHAQHKLNSWATPPHITPFALTPSVENLGHTEGV
ncbi:MAG: hypothetical protein JNL70_07010 [Saprospiraceae bacterium]|nr:hypothetical protein [Saprospiraceae bacterium]